MDISKKQTQDGREFFEVTKPVKVKYFKKDIQKQIDNLDKSIKHFQDKKKELKKLYDKLK